MDIKDNTGKKKSTHKKVIKHVKDPGVKIGSKYVKIDRICAENGAVVVYMKDGTKHYKKPSEAARDAYMFKQKLKQVEQYQPHLRNHHIEMIEDIIEAIKKAKYQLECGEEGAKTLDNMMSGRDVDGKPLNEKMGTLDEQVHEMHKAYPNVSEDDIAAILRQTSSFKEADNLIAAKSMCESL